MNIHEYQAKQLLAQYGVAVPPGEVCDSAEGAKSIAEKLFAAGNTLVVVKSQIHAGGRGKGTFKSGFQGGVKLASSVDEAVGFAEKMLGNVLVTKQTGAEGRQVQTLLLAAGAKIKKEFYLAVLLDRANPLAVIELADGKESVMALDAKISLDDNALYRHKDIQEMRDLNEEAPLEIEASKFNLNYIKLDGNIACLVNGAGLAMATMDIIQHYGGRPANFLDVGGGASKDQVSAAFKIILSDPHVQGILVNIFGGIMDCNVIATGIVAAVRETGLKLPLVVRLEGNNVQAGKKTLAESGLTIISGDSMADAAQKVVKAVGK